MSEDAFIPYIVVIRFDKDDGLKERLERSLPLVQAALAELGEVEPLASSYDGSCVTYLLAADGDVQPRKLLEQLHSPRSRRPSGLTGQDKVFIASLNAGVANRLERATAWLRECDLLA